LATETFVTAYENKTFNASLMQAFKWHYLPLVQVTGIAHSV
jgi:hypothetical protein